MHKLIYKSRSTDAIDRTILRDILYTSLEMNRKNRLTGVLLATATHYLQLLEGEFEEVNETFFRIASDPRHEAVKLISFSPAHERIFDKWMLKGFGLFELNRDTEGFLIEKYGEEENGVCFPQEEGLALSLMHDVNTMHKITSTNRAT